MTLTTESLDSVFLAHMVLVNMVSTAASMIQQLCITFEGLADHTYSCSMEISITLEMRIALTRPTDKVMIPKPEPS